EQTPTQAALAEMTIESVLTRWPQTAAAFQKHNMACIGCAVSSFYTITDAVNVYGLSQEHFLRELVSIISQT
ncbi:MAG: DUF1858 domain-containing protein, partial [Candidatus Promineifilaceae bacterium]